MTIMSAIFPVNDKDPMQIEFSRRLQESLDRLRKDILRVEIWATALSSCQQGVPSYEIDRRFELAPHPKKDR